MLVFMLIPLLCELRRLLTFQRSCLWSQWFEPCSNLLWRICFSSVPCPLAVAMVFHVGNNRTHSVFVEEIKVFQACVVVNTETGGMFLEPRRMENLSSSHLVCRARLAQRRPCALLCLSLSSGLCRSRVRTSCGTFIMTHGTALKPQNKSYPLHHPQQGYEPNLLFVLMSEVGEVDAATAAQQAPVLVEVNVPVVPELSLGELTQVWTLGVGSDRSLGRPKEWNGELSGFDDFAFKFSNWLSGLPGDAESFLEESVTMAQPIQWATLTTREKVAALRALIGGKALIRTKEPALTMHEASLEGHSDLQKKVMSKMWAASQGLLQKGQIFVDDLEVLLQLGSKIEIEKSKTTIEIHDVIWLERNCAK